jgi:hypothetical protein
LAVTSSKMRSLPTKWEMGVQTMKYRATEERDY